jgi:hypothetical protein
MAFGDRTSTPDRLSQQNPDIVQTFFACMHTVRVLFSNVIVGSNRYLYAQIAVHFLGAFYSLPPGALDALIHCATTSLALQERYSLVAACKFLVCALTAFLGF